MENVQAHISKKQAPIDGDRDCVGVRRLCPDERRVVVSGKFALAADERASVGNELMPLQNKPTSLRNGLPLGRGLALPQSSLVSRD